MTKSVLYISILLILCTCLAGGALGASVSYQTTSDWGSGFTGQITILNDSGNAVDDWVLEFEFAGQLSSIWDARIAESQSGRYVVTGVNWNSRIGPGDSVTFGFTGAPGSVQEGPHAFLLSDASGGPTEPTDPGDGSGGEEPGDGSGGEDPGDGSGGEEPGDGSGGGDPPLPPGPADELVVSIVGASGWDNGYTAELRVSNNTQTPIEGWEVRLQTDLNVTSGWSSIWSIEDGSYVVSNESWNGRIEPGGSVTAGFTGAGSLAEASVTECTLNGRACTATIDSAGAPPSDPGSGSGSGGGAIAVDNDTDATQITIPQGNVRLSLQLSGGAVADFTVVSNNPDVAQPRIDGGDLVIYAARAGRAGLRIETVDGASTRFLGVRVRESDGAIPGMPDYVSIASVSEDTQPHLAFWGDFEPGLKNKRVDARYIYINGGPYFGWDTWGSGSGSRVTSYIRNSRLYGQIPFFVFYNIPDGVESYQRDLQHVQSEEYLEAYFENLDLFLDLVNQESPDDMVGVVLEPDFLGYMAQNANSPASGIYAATQAAYNVGVLTNASPQFPNTIKGLVEAINYTISTRCPQCYFGWQLNLWASPAGGFTTPIPSKGIIRKTDDVGVTAGRPLIYSEAQAITQYYLNAGITSHGADFLSIDKYGLDAVGAQPQAAQDPASSIWFWNADHWTNYLEFVRAMHDTSNLPVVLWQLPVGRINSTLAENAYEASGEFPDLPNTYQRFEDSAPVYFLGDAFETDGARLAHFGANEGNDPKVTVDGTRVEWKAHVEEAAAAGVVMMMFGPGVGNSTGNLGTPPTDDFWWINKAQRYYANPVPTTVSPD